MPRPLKWRQVCALPNNNKFGPLDVAFDADQYIKMSVDEYETIRLIDLEGLDQEQCAQQMKVARTTVQGIYADARKKIASSLVNGNPLIIEGGTYQLCRGGGRGYCHKKQCQRFQQMNERKGENE